MTPSGLKMMEEMMELYRAEEEKMEEFSLIIGGEMVEKELIPLRVIIKEYEGALRALGFGCYAKRGEPGEAKGELKIVFKARQVEEKVKRKGLNRKIMKKFRKGLVKSGEWRGKTREEIWEELKENIEKEMEKKRREESRNLEGKKGPEG